LASVLNPASSTRRAAVALLAVVVLGFSACAGERPTLAERPETTTTTGDTTTTTTVPEPEGAEVATAKAPSIDVFKTEEAAAAQRQIVSGVDTSVETIPIVFLVKSKADSRAEVYLPVRPNGSSGWVDLDDVNISVVPYRIEVAITEHRLRVFDGDDVIVDEPIGVGRSDRPTPGGIYYLKELLKPPGANSVYGTYAYGLSGFSNVLKSFNGGPPVIGLHGTNDPSSIGGDVSSGCIRMQNDVIDRLVNEIGLPLGTPVEIVT
jgi:lipoprotein-anchoring transpeptidase ErfK/SrfK